MDSSARLLAIIECGRLATLFQNFVDARRYDDLANLFAMDGVFERGGKRMIGPTAIREEMAKRPDAWVTMHFCTNQAIDILDEDNATGITYYMVLKLDQGAPRGPHPMPENFEAAGMFEDRFVRTHHGWRIGERRTVGVFRK